MNKQSIIVQSDKTIVRITGLDIKGLCVKDLELILTDKIGGLVRVIGVTGHNISMDIYGVDPSAILRGKDGIVKAISLCEGIRVNEIVDMNVRDMFSADIDNIPSRQIDGCKRQRWVCQ